MKVLLALSKTDVREMVSFALESRYGEAPFEAGSARDAIQTLADHGDIDTVVCEYPGIGDILFRHIVSLNRQRAAGGGAKKQIGCVVCTSQKPDPSALRAAETAGAGGAKQKEADVLAKLNVLGYASWANVIDTVLATLGEKRPGETLPAAGSAASDAQSAVDDTKTDKELTDVDFCRIKTTLLIRVGPLQADIFIRLSGTKFIKLFQEGDVFEDEDYKRFLKEKKLEHLYLKRSECSEFLLKFKNDLIGLLQSEIIPIEADAALLEDVHETAQELLNKLGATKEVQSVVRANVQLAMKTMEKNVQLADILAKLQVNKDKYISAHSTLLPQIAGTLASAMDWKSDLTIQKLSLASFMHDVPISNHALAAVRNLTELTRKKDQFAEQEQKDYKMHSVKAAELAKQFQEIPPDVDVIILQHHEQPDGSGFPRGLTHHNISPLASVFIVAHDLVSAIFEADGAFLLEKHLESVKDLYKAGNFKKLLRALADVKIGR